jgi:hypothetical protein
MSVSAVRTDTSTGLDYDGIGGNGCASMSGVQYSSYFGEWKRLWEGLKNDPQYIQKQIAEGGVECGKEIAGKIDDAREAVKRDPQKAFEDALAYLEDTWNELTVEDVLDALQLGLDLIGFVPIPGVGTVADVVNAGVSGARGDYIGAAVSVLAAIPVVGDAIAAVLKPLIKALKKGAKTVLEVISKIDELLISAINKLPCDGKSGLVKAQLGEWFEFLKKHIEDWCFPAGTKVQTEDGEKNIEDIEPGDLVWAYDEAKDEWVLERVETVSERLYRGDLAVIATTDGKIEVTPDHPFYVLRGKRLATRDAGLDKLAFRSRGKGTWVRSGSLVAGDVLLIQGGGTVTVTGVSLRPTVKAVYNLIVRNAHSYLAGSQALVVHNGEPDCGKAAGAADGGKTANGVGTPDVKKGKNPDQEPSSLSDQLLINEGFSGQGEVIIKGSELGDLPRLKALYGEGDWVKMQHKHVGPDGRTTVIHWFRNQTTGQNVEVKFMPRGKDPEPPKT